jgi:hypothetical protein
LINNETTSGAAFPAIVVAAWRRPRALKRLLESLLQADYPAGEITLILSLDGGADAGSVALAQAFSFPAGRCEVVLHPENLGVREHILWCGDLSRRFGSVIVLEEDVLVGPAFFRYAVAGLAAYRGVPQVGAVALYAPEFNEIARLPFVPADNGCDAYFMQFPCSSGQAWDAPLWNEFRKWLEGSGSLTTAAIPPYVAGWPDSSWKKWFAAWLVETGRFVVYPYRSHTTNCSDPGGMHVSNQFQPDVQVALSGSPAAMKWRFPSAHFPPEIAYDAYMEPCGALPRWLVARHLNQQDVLSPVVASGDGRDDVGLDAGSEKSGFLRESASVNVEKSASESTSSDKQTAAAQSPSGDKQTPAAQSTSSDKQTAASESPSGGKQTAASQLPRIAFDLHGRKPLKLLHQADWCVTVRYSARPVACFPLTFRPVEANMAWQCEDSRGFFVLSRPADLGRVPLRSRFALTRYFTRGSLFRSDFLAGYVFFAAGKLLQRIGIRLKRFFRISSSR